MHLCTLATSLSALLHTSLYPHLWRVVLERAAVVAEVARVRRLEAAREAEVGQLDAAVLAEQRRGPGGGCAWSEAAIPEFSGSVLLER